MVFKNRRLETLKKKNYFKHNNRFYRWDGEINISLMSKHRGTTHKNTIDGAIKISQKNPEVLKAIAHGLSIILRPIPLALCKPKWFLKLKSIRDTKPFEDCKIYTNKTNKGYILQLNATQSYLFTKHINSNCFKTPWNRLGAHLYYS